MGVNLNYADQALRKAFAVPSPPAAQLHWLESRDLHTRSKMVEMLRLAMPQGEALTKALAERASLEFPLAAVSPTWIRSCCG